MRRPRAVKRTRLDPRSTRIENHPICDRHEPKTVRSAIDQKSFGFRFADADGASAIPAIDGLKTGRFAFDGLKKGWSEDDCDTT